MNLTINLVINKNDSTVLIILVSKYQPNKYLNQREIGRVLNILSNKQHCRSIITAAVLIQQLEFVLFNQ